MSKLYVLDISADEDLDAVIDKIYRETQLRNWNVWEGPLSLYGNYKVLRLISAMNASIICKVSGPGHILDKIYQYFSTR